MRPSLRQLEYAIAVADALSFREAARTCRVTQPALSTQIAALEELLGVRLFERDRRRVLLTLVGAEVIARARKALLAVDEVVEGAHALGRPLSGTLRLGVIPTVAPYLLPRALPVLRRRFPELRLYLREDQTAPLCALLAAGKLDLLLLALEAELGDVETTPIGRDRFLLALSRRHPLARRKTVRDRDLRGQTMLLLEDGHCLRDQVLSVCRDAGPREAAELRASSLGTLAQMVSSGAGLTLLPEIAVDAETKNRELVVRPFTRPAPARTLGLAWRRTSPRGAEFRALAEALRGA